MNQVGDLIDRVNGGIHCPICGTKETTYIDEIFRFKCGFRAEYNFAKGKDKITHICTNNAKGIKSDKVCDCPLDQIMIRGCTCGGK